MIFYPLRIKAVKSALCFLFFLTCSCSGPDKRYDIGKLYQESGITTDIPVTTDQLPKLQYYEAELLTLPQAKQGRIALSLEQAVFYGLQRNRELQVERYTPLIKGTFEEIERGLFDPELFSRIQYSEEKTRETSRSTEEQFSVEGSEVEAAAGVRRQLPTGTGLEASVQFGRSTSNRTPEQQDVRLGLNITQSLLQGFGPAVNLASIRQAQLDANASQYELRGFVEALVYEIETAYWRYVLASEGITIFEQSREIAKQQLRDVENRIEVGVLPKNSAAAARSEVARREQALLEARSTHIERRLRLLRLLNVTEDEHFQLIIDPTSQPRMVTVPLSDIEERLQLALLLRPDLNEARLRRQQQRLEVVRTRNGLLPRLELFMDIGKTGYADSFHRTVSDLDKENYDLLTGIRFSTYLDNRSSHARHLAARASRDQAGAAVENLHNMVLLDVRLALNEIERTRQQIKASRVTRELEEQTLKAEQDRFSVGDTTTLLVAQAQRDLLVSRLAEIEAVIDYRIALVKLFLSEGSLLERRGIRLEK